MPGVLPGDFPLAASGRRLAALWRAKPWLEQFDRSALQLRRRDRSPAGAAVWSAAAST
ncbi:MAG: hypothetical protein OEL91_05015 [Burkholderiaceae bacterium]|nr:hypothetical protein [Burkholderiaceae bacterium]